MLDKRTGVALLACVVLLAAAWPIVRTHPLAPEDGIFPVAVDPASPFLGAVGDDARFRILHGDESDLRAGRIALWLPADGVTYDDGDPRSVAALHALAQATRVWLEGRLETEGDAAAAFPVAVNLLPEARDLSGSGDQAPPPSTRAPPSATSTGSQSASATSTTAPPSEILGNASSEARIGLRPSEVDPPFPVRSLLLTFAFLIPMNLIAQLYAGSLLAERTRDRALILLSAPVSGPMILFGRTLPYAALAVGVVLVAGVAMGAGLVGMAAALPMVLVVIALAMVLGLLSRNERELTFLLTGATTMVSTFLFLPAVFSALPPIAFVSPVSVVSAAIDGRPVGWGPFLYATIPLSLVTVAIAAVSASLYREETLLSTRGLMAKTMEGLRRRAAHWWSVLTMSAFTVPFALALELFILALVIPLGLRAAFPIFIVGVAFVEEALKLVASRAHLTRAGATMSAWRTGLLSGAGFFLGEKLALLVALVGFGLLPLGEPSLALWGVGGGILLIAPLLLHAGTAALSAIGVRRSKAVAWLCYLAACVVHAAYNIALVVGGLR